MPLSDREQQLLEQMERALVEDDPKFATSMRGGPRQARNRRRLLIGGTGVIVGLGVILLGVTMAQVIIGAVGFAVMVGAVVYAATDNSPSLQVVPEPGQPAKAGKAGKPGKAGKAGKSDRGRPKGGGFGRGGSGGGGSTSFMQKMEERWDKRRDEDGLR